MKQAVYWLSDLLMVLVTIHPIWAQELPAKESTVSFKVYGVCEMCKDRIEITMKRKGIHSAAWDVLSKQLTVAYDPSQATINKMHKWLAEAGHDTELKKAKNIAYLSLPDCCRYREVKEHFDDLKNIVAAAKDSGKVAKDSTNSHQDEEETKWVKGIVMDVDKKGRFQPLPGASISWLGTNIGTITDTNGIFRIPSVGDRRKLFISYSGHSSDTVMIDGKNELKIILASGNQLKAVEVRGRRGTSFTSSLSALRTQVMTERELFKAACCNLSESFETNPSVDVSYSDAVTGAKQIQLLGLSGNYTQLTVENLPGPRGIATPWGLNSIAGPWIESIQLTKGIGSVINGYESIAGQINIELKKPENSERLYANGYVNDKGKTDLNLNLSRKIGSKWSTALLLHDDFLKSKMDFNMDHFRDLPTGNLFSAINRWKYGNDKGFMMQFGMKILRDDKTGGDMHFNPDHKFTTHHYGLGIETRRYEGFAKIGYVFPQKKYKSIGWQLSGFDHNQVSYFGLTSYNARQQNFYSNLIYQSIINNTSHKFRTGLSFAYDKYNEQLNSVNYNRKEIVPGAFFEYTYSYLDKFSVVAGMRMDHNSLFGWFGTPRLHLRYEPIKGTTIRFAFGRGQRTANIIAENTSVLASSRQLQVLTNSTGKAYGLDPEVAWNEGFSLDQKFSLFSRNGMASVDFYRTDFSNQVIVDLEEPGKVKFYNLDGRSYSNSFQAEVNYELVRHLDLRLAYRLFDVKTTFTGKLLQRPLVARHRAFVNLAYEISGWKFDYTLNYIGQKRIPSTATNPPAYQRPEESPSYVQMNAQVTKSFGKKNIIDLYVGADNLTNFFQNYAIIAFDQPFGPYFDASLVWGPVSGRMFYAGFRFKIK